MQVGVWVGQCHLTSQIEVRSLVGGYRLKNKTEIFMLSEYRSLPVRYVKFLLVIFNTFKSKFESYLKIKLLLHAKFTLSAL